MDDIDNTETRLFDYFDPEFDSIGVACNCHPTFEQFCVIELGSNIWKIESRSNISIYTQIPDLLYFYVQPYVHEHRYEIPQLMMKGDPRCVSNRTDGYCA